MTQFIEHYKCNDAPCIHVDPALPIAEFDYLVGLSPVRYPMPVPMDIPRSMCTALWVRSMLSTDAWLMLCFDADGFTG